jgi:hypothetical protein
MLPCGDDFGCFEATPLVIRGKCYPLQPAIRPSDIEKWNKNLEDCSLLRFWEYGGRLFAQFTSWDQHNEILVRHNPTTPCPPWIMKDGEFDPRLGTETLQAYARISVALGKLGWDAKYRQICAEARCSMSTLSKYRKQKENELSYTPIHPATDATPKNPNPNPNPLKERERPRHPAGTPPHVVFKGEFKNVFLGEDELKKLGEVLGEKRDSYVERLSSYLAQIGDGKAKKYKSHYATIRNWDRMDREKQGQVKGGGGNGSASYRKSYSSRDAREYAAAEEAERINADLRRARARKAEGNPVGDARDDHSPGSEGPAEGNL